MARLTYTRAEWLAIANELTAPHRPPTPPGLVERVRALLDQAPVGWPGETYSLELDAACAEAVQAAHAAPATTEDDAGTGQFAASLAEAEAIVRDHRAPPAAREQVWIGKDTNALELQGKADRFLAALADRGGALVRTHYAAVALPPGGVEYSLCLVYRATGPVRTPHHDAEVGTTPRTDATGNDDPNQDIQP